MMKWLCLLLLVANIGYFGWTLDQRDTGNRAGPGRCPGDSPGRARGCACSVNSSSHPYAAPRWLPVPKMTAVRSWLRRCLSISTTLPESLITPMRLEIDACFSFGPFAEAGRAEHLHDWLVERDGRAGLRQETGGGEQLLWVYLAPETDAEEMLNELQASGIRDVEPYTGGNLENAISLGLFSSQAAVNRRLRELQDKGYQPVVIPYNEGRPVYWVDARILQSDTIEALTRTFPSGLNYLPVQCDKIALSGPNP
ncbi:MAG: SPOR domain-containing protein [Gammaproteobacteria bacterium]|nr:SPOR domain-containing protein [Gammaproteobacteria bacterium]